jgi:hypothetical protein
MRSSIAGLKKLGFAECSRHAFFQRLTVGSCAPSGPLPSPWALVLCLVLGQRLVLRLSLGATGHCLGRPYYRTFSLSMGQPGCLQCSIPVQVLG